MGEAVNDALMAFKKALIELALAAELGQHSLDSLPGSGRSSARAHGRMREFDSW